MKIKTIIILLTIVFITFLIYIFNKDEKIYVLSLGKNESNSSYMDALKQKLKENNLLEQNINITKDLNQILEDINQNKKVQTRTMKNHLIKADIIIVTTTSNKENINELIKEIKKYSKEKIILIGENTSDNIKISRKYEVEFIKKNLNQDQIYENIYEIIEENLIK